MPCSIRIEYLLMNLERFKLRIRFLYCTASFFGAYFSTFARFYYSETTGRANTKVGQFTLLQVRIILQIRQEPHQFVNQVYHHKATCENIEKFVAQNTNRNGISNSI